MRKIFLAVFIGMICQPAASQRTDKKLQSAIRSMINGYKGDIGIYIKNLRTGKIVSIDADTVFPTASIVKLPIFLGITDRMYRGELDYDSSFIYKDSLLYEGADILGSFKSGEKIALKKLIMLMLTTSDNTASLWLQSLAGTGTRINSLLDSLGFTHTRVNSRTPGREENRARFGWGQTTAREMGVLLEKIYRKEIYSEASCDRMLRCLGRNFWDENEGISVIPSTIEVFSKNGCVNASRSEVMIVNAPRNPFVLCIFTKNNQDTSWKRENEAWAMARKLAAYLWEYYK
ncbi:MAG: serine hydrolase [Sphingobacteriales bacterium]|nr:serine hydrolase [Sphingobacteriales bacterium]